MSAGFFGDANAAAPEESTRGERHVKLFPWDSVASQLFEPFQESAIDDLIFKEICSGAAKGNKKTAYHSHLCANIAKDPWHVGAGIPQTAAILQDAIKNYKSQDMQQLIKDELRAKIDKDVAMLETILEKLNVGKGSQADTPSGAAAVWEGPRDMQQLIKDELRAKIHKDVAMLETILEKLNSSQASRDAGTNSAAKKAKTSAGPVTTPTEKEVVQAAKALHAWLSEERTPFRSLLFILAGKKLENPRNYSKTRRKKRLKADSGPNDFEFFALFSVNSVIYSLKCASKL
eukprot:s413_g16.t1